MNTDSYIERRIEMNPTIVFWTIVMSLVGTVYIVAFYYIGREDEQKKEKTSKILFCATSFTIFLISFVLVNITIKNTMRCRLAEPIVCEGQLYGYKIVGRNSSQKDSDLSSSVHLIDIEDLLGLGVGNKLRDVKVDEDFFPELELGDSFLPQSDPNAPAIENQ